MEVHEHLLPIQGELLTQGKDGRQEWGKGGEERPRAEREDWVQGLAGAGSGKDGALKSRECRAFGQPAGPPGPVVPGGKHSPQG